MKTYVIMKTMSSPIVRVHHKPHLVFGSRKRAKDKCKDLNKKSMGNIYWVESVNMGDE